MFKCICVFCNENVFSLVDSHSLGICAALVKFNCTVVVLDDTCNGNNIADLKILAALETEALDYSFAYFDIDRDILVICTVCRGNLNYLATENLRTLHCCAILKSISLLGCQKLLRLFYAHILGICATLVKFDRAAVILDSTRNGNNISDLEVLAAFETEALNYSFTYLDVDCDILIICAVGRWNFNDFTAKNLCALHCCAILKSKCFLYNFCDNHIGGSTLGKSVSKGNGNCLACFVLYCSDEVVKRLCIGFFVYIYYYHALIVGCDNDVLGRAACSFYSPVYRIFNAVYIDSGYHLVVLGSGNCGVLIHCIEIFFCEV